MELKDTVEMMQSKDYKDRFKAEYYQLLIRFNKLTEMMEKWDNGTLPFTPTCSKTMYCLQLSSMSSYLAILRARAAQEHVDL